MIFEIILASYNPQYNFFSQQIRSILNQTYTNWLCHIVDDCSSLESQKMIHSLIGNHSKYKIHFHKENLGTFYNFERGLSYISNQNCIVALSDQDDIWDVNKLKIMLDYFVDDVILVHSDLCIISSNGAMTYSSCWEYEKRNPIAANVEFLLVHNCVTGCSLAFLGSLLPCILPFPQDNSNSSDLLHDWWIALVAFSIGKVISLNQKLVSYRQHDNNVVGAKLNSGSILVHFKQWSKNLFKVTFKGYLSYKTRWKFLVQRLNQTNHIYIKSNIPSDTEVESIYYFLRLFLQSVWHKYGGYGSFLRLLILKILLNLHKIFQA